MIMFSSASIIIAAILFTSSVYANDVAPSCMDEDGNPVDWYIAYKIPALSNQPKPFKTGYAYAYITSESVKSKDPLYRSNLKGAEPENSEFFTRFKDLLISYMSKISTFKRDPSIKGASAKAVKKNDDLYWTISAKLITDPKSIVMRTLSSAYENDENDEVDEKLNSIYYNDQPPKSEDNEHLINSDRRAHAKGALLIDDESGNGVWLTHSTPRFPPPRREKLEFHENSRRYGQTFMCINFDTKSYGNHIIKHLVNMFPTVYDSKVSQHLLDLLPDLHLLTLEKQKGRRRSSIVTSLEQTIKTRGGQDLELFSKSAKFGEDMYANWMNHVLKTGLFVETWRKGAGDPLNSTCPREDYHVNNVHDLRVVDDLKNKINWSYTQDHSKWAISENIDPGTVCIADVNRMESQFKRGGGAVCIKCPSCWSVFSRTVADLEPCPVGEKSKVHEKSKKN